MSPSTSTNPSVAIRASLTTGALLKPTTHVVEDTALALDKVVGTQGRDLEGSGCSEPTITWVLFCHDLRYLRPGRNV